MKMFRRRNCNISNYLDRERRCVSCRSLSPVSRLYRITYSRLEDCYGLDTHEAGQKILQGRSVYVCPTQDCIMAALKGRKMQKALKRAIPDDILEALRTTLNRTPSLADLND